MVRSCTKCGQEKPESDFNRYGGKKKGIRADCKKCQSKRFAEYASRASDKIKARSKAYHAAHPEVSRRYALAHPEKIKAKNALRDYRWLALEQKYGISKETFDSMLLSQDGRCAICKTMTPGGRGQFHVDHDHATGKVRGLLCHFCNVGLGHFSDDIDRMVSAVDYLRRHR